MENGKVRQIFETLALQVGRQFMQRFFKYIPNGICLQKLFRITITCNEWYLGYVERTSTEVGTVDAWQYLYDLGTVPV